jgi:hypothetical protein
MVNGEGQMAKVGGQERRAESWCGNLHQENPVHFKYELKYYVEIFFLELF